MEGRFTVLEADETAGATAAVAAAQPSSPLRWSPLVPLSLTDQWRQHGLRHRKELGHVSVAATNTFGKQVRASSTSLLSDQSQECWKC